jgi:hypothetical protein
MARRGTIALLVLLVVTQVAAGMVLASVCNEPCPDDNGQRGCPPLCSFCTTCVHAQQAVVQGPVRAPAPAPMAHNLFAAPQTAASSQLAADIFHIPLPG